MLIKKVDRKRCGLFAVIMVQVLICLLWANSRENYYWDEYFSFENAHYVGTDESDHYFTTDKNFEPNVWNKIDDVTKTLVVDYDSSVFNKSIYENFSLFLTYKPYMILLNIANGLLSEGNISIWPAVFLNCILLLLSQLMLFKIAMNISHNNYLYSICSVILYGCSPMCISMVIFVRFYIWVTFGMNCILYFILEAFDEKNIFKYLIELLLAAIILYILFLNAQFALVWGGVLAIAFFIVLVMKKEIKKIIMTSIVFIVSIILLCLYAPTYVNALISPSTVYENSTGAMHAILGNIVQLRQEGGFFDRIVEYLSVLLTQQFGCVFIGGISTIAILWCLLKYCKGKSNASILVLTITVILFSVFSIAGLLYIVPRYISYIFPQISLLLCLPLIYVDEKIDDKNTRRTYLVYVTIIALEILCANYYYEYDMVYKGDGPVIDSIKNEKINSLVILDTDCGLDSHILYESCVLINTGEYFYLTEYNGELLKDKMILCAYNIYDDNYVETLFADKYSVERLGSTYRFDYYKMELKEPFRTGH